MLPLVTQPSADGGGKAREVVMARSCDPGRGMREKLLYNKLMAASNPALNGWRGKGNDGGDETSVPGKGMRAHQNYDELVAASNPALNGWRRKGKGGGDGTFVPGKRDEVSGVIH